MTLAPASEFRLKENGLVLTRGHISVVYPMRPSFQLELGPVAINNYYPSVLSATPDRAIVEEGWVHYQSKDAKEFKKLPEGVEHRLQDGQLQPVKKRTLPTAVRSKDANERVVFRLDLNDSRAIERKLPQGMLIRHGGRPMLASKGNSLKYDSGKDDLLTLEPNTAIRFRYYTKSRHFDIYLQNPIKKTDAVFRLPFQPEGHWTTMTLPVGAMKLVENEKVAPAAEYSTARCDGREATC